MGTICYVRTTSKTRYKQVITALHGMLLKLAGLLNHNKGRQIDMVNHRAGHDMEGEC